MRLAAKLILLFLVGVLLIVGVFSYLIVQQDRAASIAAHQALVEEVVATIQPRLDDALRRGDLDAIKRTVQRSGQVHRKLEFNWIEIGPITAPTQRTTDSKVLPNQSQEWMVGIGRVTTLVMPDPSGQEWLHTFVPIKNGNEVAGSVEVTARNELVNRQLTQSITTSAIALLSVTLLSCGVIWIGGISMVARPLEKLIDKVHRAGQGDFAGPVQINSTDELARLGSALNEMCDQLLAQRDQIEAETASRITAVKQLRHADRLRTIGRLAAGVAHEMGTPLNVVSGRAELIASGRVTDQDACRSAEIIKGETDRITKIVRELLDFARRGTPSRSPHDLVELTQQTIRLLATMAAARNIKLEFDSHAPVAQANVDRGQIHQVLTNLVVNAMQAVDNDGTVKIFLERVPGSGQPPAGGDASGSGEQAFWAIAIQDDGSGIAAEHFDQIFEPFFTTKDVGEGTGLGLSIAYGIVRDHDGWIDVDSEPGRGSRFTVMLPVGDVTQRDGSDLKDTAAHD